MFHTKFTVPTLDAALLQALEHAGVPVTVWSHTDAEGLVGANDEELCIYSAFIGNKAKVKTVIVITTGIHGAERELGTMFLIYLLKHPAALRSFLGDEIGLLIIDNVNAWGASFVSRFNESGQDVNRICQPWRDIEPSAHYTPAIHRAINPPMFNTRYLLRTAGHLLSMHVRPSGHAKLKDIIARGQDFDPDGLIHTTGGDMCFAVQTVKQILIDCLLQCPLCEDVVHLDVHTALGPWAELVLVSIDLPWSQAFKRAQRVFGDALESTKAPDSLTRSDKGVVEHLFRRALAEFKRATGRRVRYTGVCVEVGTYFLAFVVGSMWVRAHALRLRHADPDMFARNDDWTRELARMAFSPQSVYWRRQGIRRLHTFFHLVVKNIHGGALEVRQ